MTGETPIADFTPEPPSAPHCLESVGEKVAGLMHDLSGPLGVIQGFAELMSESEDEAERREFLAEIIQQVRRIVVLRDETLAFARGQRPVLLRPVQLRHLVRTFAAAAERELEGSHIAFELTARYLGPATLDEAQVVRVVENLARNAREAIEAGKGSNFRIDVDADEDRLLLAFTDDGPGMPEAMQGHLFEAFHTSGKVHGTGLGLAIVQRVAVEHGGRAQCVSQPGVGTRVELMLPVLPVVH